MAAVVQNQTPDPNPWRKPPNPWRKPLAQTPKPLAQTPGAIVVSPTAAISEIEGANSHCKRYEKKRDKKRKQAS